MPKYEVTVDINSITYEIEANNEDEAMDMASSLAMQETQYDLLKWANYIADEIED